MQPKNNREIMHDMHDTRKRKLERVAASQIHPTYNGDAILLYLTMFDLHTDRLSFTQVMKDNGRLLLTGIKSFRLV